MELTKFNEKLNKVEGNIYTVEEVVTPIDGVYEADLAHDNIIDPNTINIYTGSKLTGDKINTYTISTPSLTPWRTHIKIYSNEATLYISYETTGDTVEADDINNVQDAINITQESLNGEITRAEQAEILLQQNIDKETERAEQAESQITTNLNNEITRAKKAENTITTNLNSEIERAKNVEASLTNDLSSEVTRAKNAEKTLTNNLNSEITRAENAEKDIQNTINTNKPKWDDKYTKAEIDNKISAIMTNTAWKDSVATYSDLATTYPTPQAGWTVYVEDTGYTFRYDNNKWVKISTYNIPLATSSHDGRMSSSDKSFLDTVRSKWNSITTHISDTIKHITSAERTLWNTVSNKLDKTGGKISNTNYRGQLEINRDMNGDDYYSEIVFSNQTKRYGGLGFNGKEGAIVSNADASRHYKIYHEGNKPKLSELTNDAGYIKSTDNIATQSHTHSNKDVLDKLTDYDLTHYIFTKGTGSNKNNMWYKLATMTITKRYDDYTVLFHVQDCGHGGALSNSGFIQMRVKQQNNLGQLPYSSLVLLNMYGLNANNFKLVVTENTTEKTVASLYYYNSNLYSTLDVKIINTTALYNLTLHDKEEPISSLPSGTQISAIDTQKNYVKKHMTWNELEGV